MAIDFSHVVHAAHIGMGNAPGNADLIAEPFEELSLTGIFFGQKLERHRLAEREVIGAIDLAHAALPQQRDNAVTAHDQTARKETPLVQR